jgi:hypothetical protein
MFKAMMLSLTLLLPAVGWTCDTLSSDRECNRRLSALVAHRLEAIRTAFGDLEPIMPVRIDVKVLQPGAATDPNSKDFLYDSEKDALYFARRISKQTIPTAMGPVREYWAIYQNEELRKEYGMVESVDNALWNVYLKEAASRNGQQWPHSACEAREFAERLPCEMLQVGAAEYINRERQRLFNTNLLGAIWPEDYERFCEKVWHRDDEPSKAVRLYGGQLLLQPLVRKFGIARALAYAAQTPFTVEGNNMRTSALRYQEQALNATLW